eukprot:TRINITY_DN52831_c0_g2_i1.p1 TRINITY_DN52831_c0_g2~~TRINITY_DN52831_c0_g2_i1.p1  ORF type:complete len:947 (+),score=218.06 TRINITY_DN52831_c0_g2_i1:141-2981(+)
MSDEPSPCASSPEGIGGEDYEVCLTDWRDEVHIRELERCQAAFRADHYAMYAEIYPGITREQWSGALSCGCLRQYLRAGVLLLRAVECSSGLTAGYISCSLVWPKKSPKADGTEGEAAEALHPCEVSPWAAASHSDSTIKASLQKDGSTLLENTASPSGNAPVQASERENMEAQVGTPVAGKRQTPYGKINHLIVLPRWRGKGIGRLLFEGLIRHLETHAPVVAEDLRIVVVELNHLAMEWYWRLGFSVVQIYADNFGTTNSARLVVFIKMRRQRGAPQRIPAGRLFKEELDGLKVALLPWVFDTAAATMKNGRGMKKEPDDEDMPKPKTKQERDEEEEWDVVKLSTYQDSEGTHLLQDGRSVDLTRAFSMGGMRLMQPLHEILAIVQPTCGWPIIRGETDEPEATTDGNAAHQSEEQPPVAPKEEANRADAKKTDAEAVNAQATKGGKTPMWVGGAQEALKQEEEKEESDAPDELDPDASMDSSEGAQVFTEEEPADFLDDAYKLPIAADGEYEVHLTDWRDESCMEDLHRLQVAFLGDHYVAYAATHRGISQKQWQETLALGELRQYLRAGILILRAVHKDSAQTIGYISCSMATQVELADETFLAMQHSDSRRDIDEDDDEDLTDEEDSMDGSAEDQAGQGARSGDDEEDDQKPRLEQVGKPHGKINHLAVLPRHRGRGVARLLWKALLEHLPTAMPDAANDLRVLVADLQVTAIQWFQRLGFKVLQLHSQKFGNDMIVYLSMRRKTNGVPLVPQERFFAGECVGLRVRSLGQPRSRLSLGGRWREQKEKKPNLTTHLTVKSYLEEKGVHVLENGREIDLTAGFFHGIVDFELPLHEIFKEPVPAAAASADNGGEPDLDRNVPERAGAKVASMGGAGVARGDVDGGLEAPGADAAEEAPKKGRRRQNTAATGAAESAAEPSSKRQRNDGKTVKQPSARGRGRR